MSQNLLTKFGTPEKRLQMGLLALQQGKGILVVDDEDRENEGDLIFSATSLTTKQMALMIRECSGIVCLCITQDKAQALGLRLMVETNTSTYGTAFTVTIEAAKGVTTGVSASDRVTTIRAAIADDAGPQDIHCPGHVFPLLARAGGVLERPGHTEATIDLMKLAGLPPYGVLCELTNIDGTMAKLPEIIAFAKKHDYPVLSVQDIVQHLKQK